MRPFRFGVQCSTAASGAEWRERALRIEGLGYSTAFSPDHFGDQWAPTIAMTIAAEATTTLKVGALVYDVDYRHPLVLAKEMATLDLATEGRVEFGIGAGWMASDYAEAGITYDRPGIRIKRLVEATKIAKGLWSGEPFSFDGEHYTITEATGTPTPHTPGGPPVLIGGGGKVLLTAAAQLADIVGLNASLHDGNAGPEAVRSALGPRFAERYQWVKDAAGDRFDQIEIQLHTFTVQVVDDPRALFEMMAPSMGITADEAETVPMVLAGPIESIVEQLHHHRETYGASYIVVHEGEIDAFAPVVAQLAGI